MTNTRDSGLKRPLRILLVEDNPGDVLLIKEALKGCAMQSDVTVVSDGVEALAFLQRQGGHSPAAPPDFIMLDLNLPRMNGHEVLSRIRADPSLKLIPVVILTGSKAMADVVRSYELHANCYVTKPVDLDRLNETVEGIQKFWGSIARLPVE